MTDNLPLLELPFNCETAMVYTAHQLANVGLHVSPSFELDASCGSLGTGICLHDPNSPCNCQLAVLRVIESDPESVSVVLHSYHGITEIFVDCHDKTQGERIKDRITQALGTCD